jgi:hypothetical protein
MIAFSILKLLSTNRLLLLYFVDFEVSLCEVLASHGDECEDGCLLVVAPCSLVEVDLRFRGAYCFHYQDDQSYLPGDGGSKHQ